jgi:hypothetical protein
MWNIGNVLLRGRRWFDVRDSFRQEGRLMAAFEFNLLFLWRWIRYRVALWQMKNVDPMYPDMIKYVNDTSEFESTYGTGW